MRFMRISMRKKGSEMQSRQRIHSRFCSLYGLVSTHLGIDQDCICQSVDAGHENSMPVDERPMEFIEDAAEREMHQWPLFVGRIVAGFASALIGLSAGWFIWG